MAWAPTFRSAAPVRSMRSLTRLRHATLHHAAADGKALFQVLVVLHAVTVVLEIGQMLFEFLQGPAFQLSFDAHLTKCTDHTTDATFENPAKLFSE